MQNITEIRRDPVEVSAFSSRLPINTIPDSGLKLEVRPNFRDRQSMPDLSDLSKSEINTFQVEQGPIESKPIEEPQQVTSRLKGVVVQIQSGTVLCEIYVGERVVETGFPPSIFPKEMRAGSPFFLEIVDVSGIRTPRISHRDATPSPRVLELHAEIDSLFEEF
jgi:hypothetical protein